MSIKQRSILGLIILIFSNLNASCNLKDTNSIITNQTMSSYNTVISFELNQKINFPDFTIQHTELKKVQGPNNAKWERKTFHFLIEQGQESQEITWSTGVIKNTPFSINGVDYELVMGSYLDTNSSVKSFKTLALNEFIIQSPFLSKEQPEY